MAVWSGADLAAGGDLTVADAAWTVDGDSRNGQDGYAVDAVGDVDGDGRTDLLVRDYATEGAGLFLGATLTGAGPLSLADADSVGAGFDDQFRVAGVPDVDGDGKGELLVGLPDVDSGQGRVGLFFSASLAGPTLPVATPDVTFLPDPGGTADRLGDSVGTVGDLDGDGLADLWIVAQRRSAGGVTAYVHLAADLPASGEVELGDAALVVLTSDSNSFGWGTRPAMGTDLDGDGLDDIVARGSGAAFRVFHSTQRRAVTSVPLVDADLAVLTGLGAHDLDLGDLDGDGVLDVVQPTGGLPWGPTGGGGLIVVPGAGLGCQTSPLSASLQWSIGGQLSHEGLGDQAARALPDIDGDGRDEVMTDFVPPEIGHPVLLVFSWR